MRLAFVVSLLVLTLGGGCAELPRRNAVVSHALPVRQHSRIGSLYSDAAASHPGQSGFVVLDRADEALDARIAVIELADTSIDAQYFDWESDRVGQLLYDEILRAADRGVRVRLLIDDIHVRPRDRPILALDGHPNIEVRIFNPFVERRGSRVLEWLRRFSHVNHRMHNKMLIVDGQALVVGGRNIADSYFGFDPRVTFRDLDLLTVGALALDAEQAFDLYWNSSWAFPIGNLHRHNYRPAESAALLADLRRMVARTESTLPQRKTELAEARLGRLDDDGRGIVWAPGELVYDRPEKIAARTLHEPSPAAARTALIAGQAKHELVVEAAYFVPPKKLALVHALRQRGVSMRILTNSLASTDLVPVHAEYAKSRRGLVEAGVQLFELDAWAASRSFYVAPPQARLSLHTKVAVIDREWTYLGSANLDPRSSFLNTEVGIAVHSPALAEKVLAAIGRDFEPLNSWQVVVDDNGALRWHGYRGGRARCFSREPAASLARRVAAAFLAVLPLRPLL
ncbi:MAG TPA: phospholipase D family protein [Polyangia bacterium]|jgi:putative cardiolipin synthase|nr:phospholipase D family protein [Polyangia bacterium]